MKDKKELTDGDKMLTIAKKSNEIHKYHMRELVEHLRFISKLIGKQTIEGKNNKLTLSILFQISHQLAIVTDRMFSITRDNRIEYEAMQFERLAQFIKSKGDEV